MYFSQFHIERTQAIKSDFNFPQLFLCRNNKTVSTKSIRETRVAQKASEENRQINSLQNMMNNIKDTNYCKLIGKYSQNVLSHFENQCIVF